MINKRRLPLSQLRAFEAAGRLGSFKAAALELSLTQSAVSHHVRSLEEIVGKRLFVREAKMIRLTMEGTFLLSASSMALDNLTDTINVIAISQSSDTKPELTLAVAPSFATRWLLPRIHHFQREVPASTVNITATMAAAQDLAKGFDAAIVYDPALPDKPSAFQLEIFREYATPVCAPSLLNKKERGIGVERIIDFDIILNASDPWDWNRWCVCVGVDRQALHSRIAFDNDDLAIQSALAGRGVALPELRFVEQEIVERRLVTPFNTPPIALGSYRFVPYAESELVNRFYQWLVVEAGKFDLSRLIQVA